MIISAAFSVLTEPQYVIQFGIVDRAVALT